MKSVQLSQDDERLVRMSKALGNSIRFRILQVLAEQEACVCGDLVDLLPLAQSTVSEHLKVLKTAGLIQGTIDGPSTCYCIDPASLAWWRRQAGTLVASQTVVSQRSVAVATERDLRMAAQLDPDQIRQAVSSHYAGRAVQQSATLTVLPMADDACCATASDDACCTTACGVGYTPEQLAGLPLGVTGISLGCGNPVGLADVRDGETVLDLGSGGGIDCFLAARTARRVIGVDMTPDMIRLARANAREVGVDNVEFRLGEIEHLPVDPSSVDLVISNCVVNLAPDKAAVFSDVHRVLRPGGRLVIADTIATAPVPAEKQAQLEQWRNCALGSLDRDTYFATLRAAGFDQIEVLDEHLLDWGDLGDGLSVVSATLRAFKPS